MHFLPNHRHTIFADLKGAWNNLGVNINKFLYQSMFQGDLQLLNYNCLSIFAYVIVKILRCWLLTLILASTKQKKHPASRLSNGANKIPYGQKCYKVCSPSCIALSLKKSQILYAQITTYSLLTRKTFFLYLNFLLGFYTQIQLSNACFGHFMRISAIIIPSL